MENSLAKPFSFGSLVWFALPNVIMMVTLSMYIIVDGIFIARFLGTTALSAANMVYPAISFEMAAAIMIATGGSAIIARKLGEDKAEEARNNFSFFVAVECMTGIIVAIIGNVFLTDIITFLGASEAQFELCTTYARIIFSFAPAFFLQTAFQTFFVTAGKPTLGLLVTLLAGVANIVLDYIFMGPLQMGIAGAAIATGIGYCIPALAGILFFFTTKKTALHFVKPSFNWQVLIHSCGNGSSEMVTNLANAMTTFLFNYMFLRYYGEDGVASITIILYFQYIFTALYFGYSNGIAPIISFKYGAGEKQQLKRIFRNSVLFLGGSAVVSNVLIRLALGKLVTVFTPAASNVYQITLQGFAWYSMAFWLMGIGIFASALFTAFSDGKISAVISFARTFLFIVGAILILPVIFGETGLWLAVPVAEALGAVIAILFLVRKKGKYCYL